MNKSFLKKNLEAIVTPILAILFALFVGAILILFSGKSPIEAYAALLRGAFGSPIALAQLLNKATPLIFTGLAVAIAFKAKALNIGGEGQLAVGAFASTLAGVYIKGFPIFIHLPLVVLAGFLAGALWAVIPAILRAKKEVSTVITTIMMNYIAIGFTRYFLNGPFKAEGDLVASEWIAPSAKIPYILKAPYLLSGGIILAIIAVIVIYILLEKTVLGYEIKAIGLNRHTSKYSGISIYKGIFASLLISGGLAGLAGTVEIAGSYFRMYEGFSPGYGFDGIPIALLANSNPIGVVFTALLFSILRTGALTMQTSVGVSRNIVDAMQGIIILFIAAKYVFVLYRENVKTKKMKTQAKESDE